MNRPVLGIPQNTIEILQRYNFSFQKKFGQNFLIDPHVLDKIITAAQISKEDTVLEIGPGIGTMTQYLAETAGKVIAVEIDKNLIPILTDTLGGYENVQIINEDILKIDINELVMEENGGKPVKVAANYRIILRRRSLWDCSRVMCRWKVSRLWYRRKSRTGCRRDLEARITERCR